MIRIVVADDNEAFRYGLVTLLDALPDLRVEAEAASGDEACAVVLRHRPDVVLMDLQMRGADDGIRATGRLSEALPDVAVLVLTMADDDASLLAALRAGARGYVVKGAARGEVERAVRTVASGGLVLGQGTARRLGALVGPVPAVDPFPDLTPREREVLDLLAGGMDNAALARHLVLSAKTVRNTVSAVLVKLGAPDRVAAVIVARAAGLGGAEASDGSRAGRDASP